MKESLFGFGPGASCFDIWTLWVVRNPKTAMDFERRSHDLAVRRLLCLQPPGAQAGLLSLLRAQSPWAASIEVTGRLWWVSLPGL